MGSLSEPVHLHKPWIQTPCIESAALSRAAGCTIFLKLDNLQPSGSFKSRGIGNLMLRAVEKHGASYPLHFYCSSGGNAGLACVTAAITLEKPATIVVPMSTSALMVGKLKQLGANVHQIGANWFEADTFLREQLLAHDKNGVYVPPFDNPDIWHGAASIVEELDGEIGDYDGIVCSVGGGGLFSGIMEGLAKRSRSKVVKVLAVETAGADSLAQSVAAGKHITLPGITSIAVSLGAIRVAAQAYKDAQSENVTCLVLSDAEAAMGSVQFADDQRILVEVSCGVSIAPVYNGSLRRAFGKGMSDAQWKQQRIVIEVCGGNNVTLGLLAEYREKYEKDVLALRQEQSYVQAPATVVDADAVEASVKGSTRRNLNDAQYVLA